MRMSGRPTPNWDLIYTNPGSNIDGEVIGEPIWSTNGDSITAAMPVSTTTPERLRGNLVVDTVRAFHAVSQIKFEVRPDGTYDSCMGVGFGPGPDGFSMRDPAYSVVMDKGTYGDDIARVRCSTYYNHDVVQGFEIRVPFEQGAWYTVWAIRFGNIVTLRVAGDLIPEPLQKTGGVDTLGTSDRIRLVARPALGFGQTTGTATRIRNISVWTMDVLGRLPE